MQKCEPPARSAGWSIRDPLLRGGYAGTRYNALGSDLSHWLPVKPVTEYNARYEHGFEELEKKPRSLNTDEKATLARILIEELNAVIDPNAEQLWLEEGQRRYEAFLRGELEARPRRWGKAASA
jgi:hypothetical protein